MTRQAIYTKHAPAAIGPYSQAIRVGQTVYCSGQIPLDPVTGVLVDGGITAQVRQAFDNLKAVCTESGGGLDDIVSLRLYMTDLREFHAVNAVMIEYFIEPYPARATIEVSALPKNALFEVEAVLVLD